MRDQEVADAWVQDRVERHAAHASLRAVFAMVGACCGPRLLERSALPPELQGIMRLNVTETRKSTDAGWCVGGGGRDDLVPVIPPGWRSRDVFIVNHTVDRCGIGASGLAFAMARQQLLWGVHWGRFHDSWNAIKSASKRAVGGAIWRGLVRFSGVANLPSGPYRSGPWKAQMQDTLTSLTSLLSADEPDFQRAAARQQTIQPTRFRGKFQPMQHWWRLFCR